MVLEDDSQAVIAAAWRWARSTAALPGVGDVDLATLQRLFDITARFWRQAGADPSQVFHSVLTSDAYRRALDSTAIGKFLGTGLKAYEPVHELIAAIGRRPPAESEAMDFGCGVGRLTVHAAKRFARVYGVDVSRGHLDVLADNIGTTAPALAGRITGVHLPDLAALQALPQVDYIFSLITLQHSTPPVMAHTVTALLNRLAPGGAAALHVPIHHPFYSFDVECYLADPASGTAMEMHVLPREDLRAAVLRSGCRLHDSVGTGMGKGVYTEIFLISRPPVS